MANIDRNHGIDPKCLSMPLNADQSRSISINSNQFQNIYRHWLALGIDRGSPASDYWVGNSITHFVPYPSHLAVLKSSLLPHIIWIEISFQVLPMYYERHMPESCAYFIRIKGYIRIYAWPVICITQMSSIWLAVQISAERFLAVVYPFQSINLRTISKVCLNTLFGIL